MSDEAAVKEESNLYQQIVEATGKEYDEEKFDDIEHYKRDLVLWFDDDAHYESASESVKNWVDAATKVAKDNKNARRKKALPTIDGLEEPEDEEEEAKPTRRRRGRTPRPKKEKVERDPTQTRYGHVARLMFSEPDLEFEEVIKRLNRDGHDYAEISLKRAYDAFSVIYKVAVDMGVLKD